MSRALEFSAQIKNGKLPDAVREKLVDLFRVMEGKRLVISVKEQKRRRSGNQNAYYWGVVVAAVTQMFRDAGNYVDDQDVHEFLKAEVAKLNRVLVSPDGEVLKAPGSTASLSTQEFEVYLEKVRAWATGMGVGIPLPNEEFQQPTERKTA